MDCFHAVDTYEATNLEFVLVLIFLTCMVFFWKYLNRSMY